MKADNNQGKTKWEASMINLKYKYMNF